MSFLWVIINSSRALDTCTYGNKLSLDRKEDKWQLFSIFSMTRDTIVEFVISL
jgi:hypothetical protein